MFVEGLIKANYKIILALQLKSVMEIILVLLGLRNTADETLTFVIASLLLLSFSKLLIVDIFSKSYFIDRVLFLCLLFLSFVRVFSKEALSWSEI